MKSIHWNAKYRDMQKEMKNFPFDDGRTIAAVKQKGC